MNKQDTAFVAALTARRDQWEESVKRFIGNNSLEEITQFMAKLADESRADDVNVALCAVLAAYGLTCGLIAKYGGEA